MPCENLPACTRRQPTQPKTGNRRAPFESPRQMPVWPRPISPTERKRVQLENQNQPTDPRDLAPALRLLPNVRRQTRSAPREVEPGRSRGPGRARGNPAPTPRLEKESRSFFGENQQHPVVVWPPLSFEILTGDPEKFPACRVVDEDGPGLPIDARYHDVV